MASLKEMLQVLEGYSSTANKMNKMTDEFIEKITQASGAVDKFNKKIEATGKSAKKASPDFGKFLKVAVEAAAKGMKIVDEYLNSAAGLNLINDGLQTQAELQDKIFAAADRAKGSYTDMADAVSRMGLLAGDSFGSTDEMIAFTELMQKSIKLGGADTSMQQDTMDQITQIMASGQLQGNELNSIKGNAPMFAKAIEDYMENVVKAKGTMEEWAEQGLITAEVMKNALFMAGNDIDKMFAGLPNTFSDYWNQIKNGALQAFGPVIEKVKELIKSDEFMGYVNTIIAGFDLAGQAVGGLIDTVVNGWNTIGPILGIIGGLLLLAIIINIWKATAAIIAQGIAWMGSYWPLLLIIGIIAIVISAARQMGATWEEIFGFIGGVIGVFAGVFYNLFLLMWNIVAAFINFFGNAFKNPIASIKILFWDLVTYLLRVVLKLVKGFEDLLNSIPGIEVDITSRLTEKIDGYANNVAELKNESGWTEYVKPKDYVDLSESYNMGGELATKISTGISDTFDNLSGLMTKDEDKGTQHNPTIVQGTGNNGKFEVDMSDEDIKYLRDIAERDYINKFSSATLAPNVNITFGDVHETADINKLKGTLEMMMREEIAVAAEGSY